MSRKLPKKYKPQPKSTVTAEDERQAKRVIGGIVAGLFVIMLLLVGAYYFTQV